MIAHYGQAGFFYAFIGEFGFGPNGYAGKPGTLKVFRVFVSGLVYLPLSFAILNRKEMGCLLKLKKTLSAVGGFLSGAVNGLLGAGGGMIAVPMLSKSGLDAKSHATSSGCHSAHLRVQFHFILTDGRVTLGDAAPYLFWGPWAPSSVPGCFPKSKTYGFTVFSGVLMLWAAVRMLFR